MVNPTGFCTNRWAKTSSGKQHKVMSLQKYYSRLSLHRQSAKRALQSISRGQVKSLSANERIAHNMRSSNGTNSAKRISLISSGACLLSYCIWERISDHLWSFLHLNVVAHTRSRTPHFSCYTGIAVILVIQLMHPNQLIRRYSRSHSLLRLCRTGSSLQLGIRMFHCLFPALIEIATKSLDLRVGAAVFLDHFVDCIQLVGVIVAAISRGHGR